MELADRTAGWVLAETQAGRLKQGDYLDACLDRIAAREPEVKAWVCLDAEAARTAAGASAGVLAGMPLGVKDVFDTLDWPTSYGSPLYAGHRPGQDAAAVALARAAGCVLPGKTVTTEFAYFHPGPTANPHNTDHTPGGSSSGSAAAVGAGMVPFALGTQTAGSVVRPAAFCGVVGYKPTFGTIATFGVKQFAWSLDTVGVFARDLADAALLAEVLSGLLLRPSGETGSPRIGFYKAALWSSPSEAMAVTLEKVAAVAEAAGAQVTEVILPDACASLFEDQKLIMAYEGARSLAHERRGKREALSTPLLELTDAGARVDPNDYLQARARSRQARAALAALFQDVDVLLTPSAPGAAPRGLEATGDPAFNRAWTLLGQPCVTLPAGRDPSGLPLGVQLVGGFDDDARLLAAAAWLERVLAA